MFGFVSKLFKKKINVVFVCHRPNVWGSLKTIYEECINDDRFNVTIIAVPCKKQLPDLGLSHEVYESEGAEEYFKNFECNVINGYNYFNNKWFNLKKLKPDYVFFQTPYNIIRPKKYRTGVVSKYTKILYVHYAANFIGAGILEESYPLDFIKDIYTIFVQDERDQKLIEDYLKNNNLNIRTLLTGFPRYDELDPLKGIDSKNWNLPRNNNVKRVIWTPRWTTNEGNCNFFEYKDFLIEYANKHSNFDFIFRPHPQAFLEWNATGELPEVEAEKYKKEYSDCNNAKIDSQKEYLTTFYSSDFMITDISSIVAEYFLTGKPIIYCHKKDCFNDFSRKLSEGFYWVRNQKELEERINDLMAGNDPLEEVRKKLIKENFYINPKKAGKQIKEYMLEDFNAKN